MANYSNLISAIQSVITTNGNNEITGAILQQTLLSVINTLGTGYQFIGIAQPSTNPGNPDDRVFYIGGPGTYSNFGPAVVPSGSLGIFYYDTAWHVETLVFPLGDGAVDTAKLADEAVTQGKIAPALLSLIKNGYVYKGIAGTSTNPGTPERDCFYFASGPGTYTNFGNTVVPDNKQLNILKCTGSSWSLDSVDFGLAALFTVLYGTGDVSIDVSAITSCGSRIGSTNIWETTNVNKYYGGLVDVSQYQGRNFRIISGGTSSGGGSYAFVKSGVSLGNAVDFAAGWSGYATLPTVGQETNGIIPDDAVYLYVYLQSPGQSYRPQQIKILATGSLITDVQQLQDDVAEIRDIIGTVGNVEVQINVNGIGSCGSRIGSTNIWETANVNKYYGGLVDVTAYRGNNYKIVSSGGGSYAFVKSGVSLGNAVDFAAGWSAYVAMGASGTEYNGVVPGDAVYLYVYLDSNGTSYRPQSISFYADITDVIEAMNNRIDQLSGDFVTLFEYNIGHFSNGVQKNSTITAAQYLSKVDGFRALLSNQKPHIYGIVEYSAIFGKNTAGNNVNTKDELFNFQDIEFESSQMNYACYALFGNNVPIYNVQINDFDCLANETITHTTAVTAQDYRYISADVYAFGVTVKLVVTHLAFDNNRPGVLTTAQISELITKYASYPYVVMLGDWNVANFSEFTAFVNAGYSMANDGSLLTFPSTGKALDNIVAKGLTIFDVQMVVSGLSDHYPLICKIQKPQ